MIGKSNAMSGGTNSYELVTVTLSSTLSISYVSFINGYLSPKQNNFGDLSVVKGSSMIITEFLPGPPQISGDLEYHYNSETDEHIILVNGNGTIGTGIN